MEQKILPSRRCRDEAGCKTQTARENPFSSGGQLPVPSALASKICSNACVFTLHFPIIPSFCKKSRGRKNFQGKMRGCLFEKSAPPHPLEKLLKKMIAVHPSAYQKPLREVFEKGAGKTFCLKSFPRIFSLILSQPRFSLPLLPRLWRRRERRADRARSG